MSEKESRQYRIKSKGVVTPEDDNVKIVVKFILKSDFRDEKCEVCFSIIDKGNQVVSKQTKKIKPNENGNIVLDFLAPTKTDVDIALGTHYWSFHKFEIYGRKNFFSRIDKVDARFV